MHKAVITTSTNTLNDIMTRTLTGSHRYAGRIELARVEHNRTTAHVRRLAGIGVNAREYGNESGDLAVDRWPAAVSDAVQEWKDRCAKLDEANAAAETVGQELFASLVDSTGAFA